MVGETMSKDDVEVNCRTFFEEEAYVYIAQKLGSRIWHRNGKIVHYDSNDSFIKLKDDEISEPIKIQKSDIVLIDYSRKRRNNGQ